MGKTKIEWAQMTLNPFVGCSRCSEACRFCYAERFAARLAKNPKTAAKYAGVVDDKGHWTGNISNLDLSCFDKLPKKPCRVFVGSMTDFFHENANFDDQGKVLAKIAHTPEHTFLLLTKRPERAYRRYHTRLPNVWLGVTVCNQEEADKKIPILLQIPAAKRFISAEPLLSKIDIKPYLQGDNKLSWVIAGGETGPNARPMHEAWVKNLRDQCLDIGTPYFFKSWGEWLPCGQIHDDFDNIDKYPVGHIEDDGFFISPPALEIPWRNHVCGEDTCKVGKKRSGNLIDGIEYRQFPEG